MAIVKSMREGMWALCLCILVLFECDVHTLKHRLSKKLYVSCFSDSCFSVCAADLKNTK